MECCDLRAVMVRAIHLKSVQEGRSNIRKGMTYDSRGPAGPHRLQNAIIIDLASSPKYKTEHWGSCQYIQSINQSINQNFYSTPSHQDPYSEVLPTQAKWKRTVLRR